MQETFQIIVTSIFAIFVVFMLFYCIWSIRKVTRVRPIDLSDNEKAEIYKYCESIKNSKN